MDATNPSLVLMGLRGSGKSTLGRAVADRLGRPCIDLDDRTVEALGATSVAEAWRTLGETAFRAAESRVLREVLSAPGSAIVSLGGGTPTAPGAADLLREVAGRGRAIIVYLHARPETLRARLGQTGVADRPSLTGRGTIGEIDEVYAARDGLYRAIATRVVEVDAESAATLTQGLVGLVTSWRPPPAPPGRTP